MPHDEEMMNQEEAPEEGGEMMNQGGDMMSVAQLVITSDELPEIEKWADGEVYEVKLKVKQVNVSEGVGVFDIVGAETMQTEEKPKEEKPKETPKKEMPMEKPKEMMPKGRSLM